MLRKSTKIITLTGIVFLCASFSVLALAFHIVSTHKIQLLEETTRRSNLKSQQESLETLIQTLESTKIIRESLYSRILNEEHVIDFLALIEALGREQGIKLTTNSLSVEPLDEVFESLVMGVSISGPYANVIHVMKLFENLPYQVTISEVQILREPDSSWSSSFEIRVTKFKKHEA